VDAYVAQVKHHLAAEGAAEGAAQGETIPQYAPHAS
jgi:hypothetical protein